MQRAGHGSKLHRIGDDGDGAMRGRDVAVYLGMRHPELRLKERLGRKSCVLFSGPWNMLGSMMVVETCVTIGIVDAVEMV